MKHTRVDKNYALPFCTIFLFIFLLVASFSAVNVKAQGTGFLEICTGASGPGLEDRIFQFQIGAQIHPVPTGSCSAAIELPVGLNTVTELSSGNLIHGGTFSGRFRLLSISTIGGPDLITTVNLANRTAVVNIAEGTIVNSSTILFTNTFAVSAMVEICKQQLTGATGVFSFTIDALPNQTFNLAAGTCSGPITVNVPASPSPVPATAIVKVTELARQGYVLNGANALPGGRFINYMANQGINNSNPDCINTADPVAAGCVIPNQGGGYATVNVQEGNAANETVVNFTSVFDTGPATGVLQICKTATGIGLEDKIFQFRIGGTTYEVPVGSCSGPLTVTAGPVTVEELNTGRTLSGGVLDTFSGGFRLTGVTASPAGALGAVDLSARTAVVNVAEGTIANQTVVVFNNIYAKKILEICNYSLDPGAGGSNFNFFNFTVDALPNRTIPVPVGHCSGPIEVNVLTPTVRVTQFAKSGFTLESASTVPADRFVRLVPGSGINNTNPACAGTSDPAAAGCTFANTGGGYAEVNVVEGYAADATIARFYNRANPPGASPPMITPSVNGTLGGGGFYISNVNVSWIVADGGSPVSSTSGCGTTTIATDTTGTTLTCSATNSIGTSSQSVTIKRDTTPPVVAIGAPNMIPNDAGWYKDNVLFPYSVSDNVSGLSASTPSSGSVVLSGEGNAVSGSVTVMDNAGNTAIVSSPVVRIDKTAPTLANLNNIRINSGTPSTATYNVTATDGLTLSPVVVCNPASGSTFPVGITTVICTATDLAGNQSAGSLNVAVYTNEQQPVPTGSNVTVEPETGLPETGLTLTFNQVDVTGVTTVEPIADPATAGEVPGGFSISNTIAYQIETTAQFTGPVVLAFQVPFTDADTDGVDDETGTAFADLRILHREQTGVDANNQPVFGLVDRTILPPDSPAPNLATRTIFARTTSFSPFYLAQKVNHQIVPLFDQSKPVKSGSTIPLKIKLLNAAGTVNLSAPGTILTVRGVTSLDGIMFAADSPGNSNLGKVFDFKTDDGGQYQYNLKTTGLAPGRYVLSFYVGSNLSYFYTVRFDIK